MGQCSGGSASHHAKAVGVSVTPSPRTSLHTRSTHTDDEDLQLHQLAHSATPRVGGGLPQVRENACAFPQHAKRAWTCRWHSATHVSAPKTASCRE